MRNHCLVQVIALIALVFTPLLFAVAQGGAAAGPQIFDPHDLTGIWATKPGAPPAGTTNAGFSYENTTPEPLLTEWAKQHLLYKSLSHDALGPNGKVADPNGVPANIPNGHYPGINCETLAQPALLDYSRIAPFEFVPSASGNRILQMFEYHREWRTLWLNQEHPKNIDPSYEGDSIAHWEGNTLVVDTIGYNGKDMITINVAHTMSDAFHLVERYRRVDHDHLQLDMTMYDPKAWGDKAWTGFHKTFALRPGQKLQEWICSQTENEGYDQKFNH
jgi:hypothetical protein